LWLRDIGIGKGGRVLGRSPFGRMDEVLLGYVVEILYIVL